jgi:hypothetical protein
MTDRDEYMTEMWIALERYQPYANTRGFGAEWKRMTTEHTEEAAWEAAREAVSAGEAAWYAADATKHINKAIEMEENK